MNKNNQQYWDHFEATSGKPRQSMNQYRSHFTRVVEKINKDFTDITPEDIDQAIGNMGSKINPIYVKTVIALCYSANFQGCRDKITLEMVYYLLPNEATHIIKMLGCAITKI